MLAKERDGTSTAEEGPFGVQAEQQFRPDIQGLRALAVLLVIADHAGIRDFRAAYIGVDRLLRRQRLRHHPARPP